MQGKIDRKVSSGDLLEGGGSVRRWTRQECSGNGTGRHVSVTTIGGENTIVQQYGRATSTVEKGGGNDSISRCRRLRRHQICARGLKLAV